MTYRLAAILPRLASTSSLLDRLQHCASAESLTSGRSVVQQFESAERFAHLLSESLDEVDQGIREFRELEKSPLCSSDSSELSACARRLTAIQMSLCQTVADIRKSQCPLFTNSQYCAPSRLPITDRGQLKWIYSKR
jgi:hypothetical protein